LYLLRFRTIENYRQKQIEKLIVSSFIYNTISKKLAGKFNYAPAIPFRNSTPR
jgi:hypothetical protein